MPFDPRKLINVLDVRDGDVVADLGAGSGFYTMECARRVGEYGKVYAVDINKDLLGRVAREAEDAHLENVHTVWGDLDLPKSTGLADVVCDKVIISNTLFQIEEKEICIQEAHRILKRTGTLLFIDWSESFAGLGPKGDHVFPKKQAVELFEKNGFEIIQEIEPGIHHYGFLAKRHAGA